MAKICQLHAERIFKNEQSKNRQIAELVRMIFTQKRERFLVSEEDRTGVHNHLLASLKFNEEEEANYKKALETVKKYRLQKEACRLARKEQHKDGHGRNKIPDDMVRLPEILVYPEECIGHMDEYREAFPGETTEFIVPVSAKYMVQGYRYTNCFLSFGKTLNESPLIYEIPGEVLADVNTSAGLNVIHSTKISAQRGALQSYKVFLKRQ